MADTLGEQTGPHGEKMLTEQTGPHGERYLCKGCCTGSNPCTLYAEIETCPPIVNPNDPCHVEGGPPFQFDRAYIPLPALCADGSSPAINERVTVSGRCWRYTGIYFQTADLGTQVCTGPDGNRVTRQLPLAATIVTEFQCVRGGTCFDADCGTTTSGYIRMEQCDPTIPKASAEFYVCARTVSKCFYLYLIPGDYTNRQGSDQIGRCYQVTPINVFNLPGLPTGSYLVGPADGQTLTGEDSCCKCTSAHAPTTPCFSCPTYSSVTRTDSAGGVISSRTTPGLPCCRDSRASCTMNASLYARLNGFRSDYYEEWDSQGSQSFPCNTGGQLQLRHRVVEAGVVVVETTETTTVPPAQAGCPPTIDFSSSLPQIGSGTITERFGCDRWARNVSSFNIILRASVDIQRGPSAAPCFGGCDGSSDLLAPQAVPEAEWPAWAKAVAATKQPGDIGVGSTIERQLGKGGEAFKAGYKRITKLLTGKEADCGCSARRDHFDKIYRY